MGHAQVNFLLVPLPAECQRTRPLPLPPLPPAGIEEAPCIVALRSLARCTLHRLHSAFLRHAPRRPKSRCSLLPSERRWCLARQVLFAGHMLLAGRAPVATQLVGLQAAPQQRDAALPPPTRRSGLTGNSTCVGSSCSARSGTWTLRHRRRRAAPPAASAKSSAPRPAAQHFLRPVRRAQSHVTG